GVKYEVGHLAPLDHIVEANLTRERTVAFQDQAPLAAIGSKQSHRSVQRSIELNDPRAHEVDTDFDLDQAGLPENDEWHDVPTLAPLRWLCRAGPRPARSGTVLRLRQLEPKCRLLAPGAAWADHRQNDGDPNHEGND